ncbi:MAG: phosphoglycolate phosphatase [Betaproteobacteria bacterium]|nr:phosphoglycolate phosphatase [Betaproteobacteria bacterium]
MSRRTRAVLFDLDGTLLDTAPDMARALNAMRSRRGMPPLPVANIRTHVGSGARGMLLVGFGLKPEDADFPALRTEFLDHYEQDVYAETVLFPGMPDLLARLDQANVSWGIVTNKASRFTLPLLDAMGLREHAACVVCGDTTPHAKPHPEPLLHACRELDVTPASALYVGDDLRDVQAARAANIRVLAAAWGYLGTGDPPEDWQADAVIAHAGEVAAHL